MKLLPLLRAVAMVLAAVPELRAESTFANGTAVNISNRARAGPGEDAAITGFAVKDAATFVLIRAVGAGLAQFGVVGYATGTTFDVVDGSGTVVTQGTALTNFTGSDRERVDNLFRVLGAFALPGGSVDSMAYLCLNPGSYSVVARPRGSSSGIILTEIGFVA